MAIDECRVMCFKFRLFNLFQKFWWNRPIPSLFKKKTKLSGTESNTILYLFAILNLISEISKILVNAVVCYNLNKNKKLKKYFLINNYRFISTIIIKLRLYLVQIRGFKLKW